MEGIDDECKAFAQAKFERGQEEIVRKQGAVLAAALGSKVAETIAAVEKTSELSQFVSFPPAPLGSAVAGQPSMAIIGAGPSRRLLALQNG